MQPGGGLLLLRTESCSSFGSDHDEIYDMLSNLPPVHRDEPAAALHNEAAAARLAPVDAGGFWGGPAAAACGDAWGAAEEPALDEWGEVVAMDLGEAADANAMCSGLAGFSTATDDEDQPAAPILPSHPAEKHGDFWGTDGAAGGDGGGGEWGSVPPVVEGAPDDAMCGLLHGGQTTTDEEDAPAAPVAGPASTQPGDFGVGPADGPDGWEPQPADAARPVLAAQQDDEDGGPDAAVFALMLDDAADPTAVVDADASPPAAPADNFWGGAPAARDNAWLQDGAANDNLWGASHTDPAQGW
jgi:hypothetical protein